MTSASDKVITQDYFDETLLENQAIFEWDDERAISETVQELKSQNVSLRNIITSHPESNEGKITRENLKKFNYLTCFVREFGEGKKTIEEREGLNYLEELKGYMTLRKEKAQKDVNQEKDSMKVVEYSELDFLSLFLQSNGIQSLMIILTSENESITEKIKLESIQIVTVCLLLPQNLEMRRKAQDDVTNYIPKIIDLIKLHMSLIKLMCLACQGHEMNKVALASSKVTKILVELISEQSNSNTLTNICQLISVLCRYDDPSASTSSAHQNVLSFVKEGLLEPILNLIQKEIQIQQEANSSENEKTQDLLVCSIVLTTLRTLSINDDIIQQLIEKGIMNVIDQCLILASASNNLHLARANMGIIRNMCQNDDIKSVFCNDYLSLIGDMARTQENDYLVQEHYCAIIAAMALRSPANSKKIVLEHNAAEYIVSSMNRYKNHVSLQRQGCLAIRNLASRDDTSEKQICSTLLDLGVEQVLREAGMFSGSVDEAYAALRDLGCNDVKLIRIDRESGEVKAGVDMFGQTKTNFKPVYEESK